MLTTTATTAIPLTDQLTLCWPDHRAITPSLLRSIRTAVEAEEDGLGDLAGLFLSDAEDRAGVTSHDRVVAMAGSDTVVGAFVPLADAGERLGRLRAALSERAARPKLRAVTKTKADDAMGRDRSVMAATLLRTLDLREADVRAARTAREKRRALNAFDRASEALRQHAEETWREDAMREAAELADLRGEPLADVPTAVADWLRDPVTGVVIRDRRTRMPILRVERSEAKRVNDHDGLETLATSHLDRNGEVRKHTDGTPMAPSITTIERAAGEKCRVLYQEAAEKVRLRTMLQESMGSGRKLPDFSLQKVAMIQDRAEGGRTLARMEQYVQHQVTDQYGARTGELAIAVLRAVAGAGATVSSIGSSGAAKRRNSRAIKAALTAAADFFGLH